MSHATWYPKSTEEVLNLHATSLETGLSSQDADRRIAIHGYNKIKEVKGRSAFAILLAQFTDVMVLVLIGAGMIAVFLGEPRETLAIGAIIVLNSLLGFVQEYRAERAMEALKAMTAPLARVRRQGKVLTIPAFNLVPGDIVLLEAGNIVPADLRLVESHHLRMDESALTGESMPIDKISGVLSESDLPIADQKNMAFKGTIVTAGRALGIVVNTGMQTELGRIATLLHEEVEVNTPLQNRIARFAKHLSFIVISLCVLIFAIGLFRGEQPVLMFMTALSLAVAAIPEALPAVVTITLALGARRMSQRNALIRKLPAVETLGSVTYICADKTGTLTENRMSAQRFFADGAMHSQPPTAHHANEAWDLLMRVLAQNNDATEEESGKINGDPTEIALLQAARLAGVDKNMLDKQHPRIAEIPFSSERGRMTTIHRAKDTRLIYVKGAPERIFPRCTQTITANGLQHFATGPARTAAEQMASAGLRVLAVAYRSLHRDHDSMDVETLERELTFVGLVGLIDPPRSEAKEAIHLCHQAGIHVTMITGDHPATARAIASDLGIITSRRQTVLTGKELSHLSAEELSERIDSIPVFARVAPEQKILLIKALQERKQVTAMTGDGVNDAPALRRADIGVAMGRGGTDVAREAAHMVLLDDNFATIVFAVREGRRIYDNIRKFVRFALSGNSGEMWALFLAPFFGLPVPLLPIHILWVNLVTDGLPGLALAAEPEERNLMHRPPRLPSENLFAHGLWQHALWVGLLIGVLTLGAQLWAAHTSSAHAQSMAFTVLTLTQMGHVLAIRSDRDSLFTQGLFSNLPLLGAVVLTVCVQISVLYVPAFNSILRTQPLTASELIFCLAISSVVFIAVEIEKWIRRHLTNKGETILHTPSRDLSTPSLKT